MLLDFGFLCEGRRSDQVDSPEDATSRTFSNASSQRLSLHAEGNQAANVSLELNCSWWAPQQIASRLPVSDCYCWHQTTMYHSEEHRASRGADIVIVI